MGIWGCGRWTHGQPITIRDGRGKNRHGLILMRVRDELRPSEARVVTVAIRPETTPDAVAIREVNRLAFGGEDEARLVDALRDGGYVKVSLVSEANGHAVGHILFSELPILTPKGTVEALALAPLAVHPSHQRRGIGSLLVREGLGTCRDAGHRIVVVLGHPDFYSRFGFSAKRAERLESPYSGPAFMALELVPGALEGVGGGVRYPPPFDLV